MLRSNLAPNLTLNVSLSLAPLLLAACVTTGLPSLRGDTPAVMPPEAGRPAVCPAVQTSAACPPCPAAAASPPASLPAVVAPTCPTPTPPPKAAERAMQEADWSDLPGWAGDDPGETFRAFLAQCASIGRQALWLEVCQSAARLDDRRPEGLRAWFEGQFRPWALVNPDGTRNGLITGYYEPILSGSRRESKAFRHPVYGPPDDLIIVDLADLHPELKHLRLRGRLDGRRLVPYYSHAEWTKLPASHRDRTSHAKTKKPLLWVDDAIELFFMQVQGSGQVQFKDGQRVRLNYADQNGHPYRSIGRWLIEQNELKLEQASMQGIKAWVKTNPSRLRELLDVNPSMVFFRELPVNGNGPPGALGVELTPERSIAIDPRHHALGAPVWLATTRPNSDTALNRLMLAQDTGGAIRGVVRADFYWGSGPEAGQNAGRMRQQGRMWILMPKAFQPPTTP